MQLIGLKTLYLCLVIGWQAGNVRLVRSRLHSNRKLVSLASLFLLLVTQLALLGHVILDDHDHDHAETCEFCLKLQQQDPQLFQSPGLFQPL